MEWRGSSSTTHFINQLNQTKSKETFNLIWFHWFLQLVDEINGIELNCIITVWVILWIWYKDKIIDGINLLMESIMNYLYEYEKYYRAGSFNSFIYSIPFFENGWNWLKWRELTSMRPQVEWKWINLENEMKKIYELEWPSRLGRWVGWVGFSCLLERWWVMGGWPPMAPPQRANEDKKRSQ